ncbi:signal peptidase II [Enemella sp. A6]|uniref:signal peptidase II n=1 Tax=Enemella sp. A6 TaxID=3440152 RepID=UPI003EBD0DE0
MQAARRTPITRPTATALLLLVAATLVAADQVTKQWALNSLEPGEPRPFLGEWLKLRLVFNPGAAFSLGAESTWIFTILASAVTLFVLFFLAPRVVHLGWALGLGLLLAGVVGNLIDRIFRDPAPGRGHVIDFLELPNWPIFNVADMCIVAAAALIIILSIFTRAQWNGTPDSEQPADEQPDDELPDDELPDGDAETSAPEADEAEDEADGEPADRVGDDETERSPE